MTDPVLISGIVLAGGASRRFGSDKLAELVEGVALLELPIQSLVGVADEIVVVVAPDRPLPALRLVTSQIEIRFTADPEPFGGPLVGIRAGLAAARGSRVVVVGGDMPSIVPGVLRLLIDRSPAALADDSGALRPLPCALDRGSALVAADALLAGGQRRLRALLAELDTTAVARRVWAAEDPAGLSLLDIDERADLPNGLPHGVPADRPGQKRGPDRAIGASREEGPGP